jgi:hypothetical protein
VRRHDVKERGRMNRHLCRSVQVKANSKRRNPFRRADRTHVLAALAGVSLFQHETFLRT